MEPKHLRRCAAERRRRPSKREMISSIYKRYNQIQRPDLDYGEERPLGQQKMTLRCREPRRFRWRRKGFFASLATTATTSNRLPERLPIIGIPVSILTGCNEGFTSWISGAAFRWPVIG